MEEKEGFYMYKLLFSGLCLILAMSFAGCSRTKTGTEKLSELSDWVQIYQITLESYLEQDTALNENIDFIAIDLSTLEYTNDEEKEVITAWFESRHMPVRNTNLDGLRAEGLFDEEGMYISAGVLLLINKVTEKNNEIIIEGMKYRGALGANWFETKWQLNNGIWEFIGTVMTMIS